MTKEYDTRFRALALAHYRKYDSPEDTCEDFGISKATLFRWLKLEKAGNLSPKKRGGKKVSKFKHFHFNRAFDKNKTTNQEELARALNTSQSTVSRSLRKFKNKLDFKLPKRNKRQKNIPKTASD
ncbi:MAG TPA: hypothetical protein DIV86_03965 [Alphaproteobacteria bacterium]|nr:hypothetical protein [Alphaproteobacteria bacterium]